MARAGWSMAALALVVTLLSALIPLIGTFIIGPLATIIIGAGAGWWASKRLGSGGAGRGAGAGSIAGLGAFIGATIGTIIIFSIMGSNPEFQQQFLAAFEQAQQQDPDAQLPPIDGETLSGAAGVLGGVAGFCMGLINIFLGMLGGLIAGAVYGKRDTPVVAAAPVGAYPTDNATIPQMSSQPTYGNQPTYGDQSSYSNQQTYGNQSYTGQTQLGSSPTDPAPGGQDEFKTRVFDPTARRNDDNDDQHKTRIYDDPK